MNDDPNYLGPRIGFVKFFQGSYGFITDTNGTDFLVHFKNIASTTSYKSLAKGQRVSFEAYKTPKGGEARDVKVIN